MSSNSPYKVILCGSSSTGKSCLLECYLADGDGSHFTGEYSSTVGTDFRLKTVKIRGTGHRQIQLWDTAGQERFRAITASYYRGSHAIILVFDLTKRKSFKDLPVWIRDINKHRLDADGFPVVMLAGNKLDLASEDDTPEYDDDYEEENDPNAPKRRRVSTEEAKKFAKKNNMMYMEVSAKTGTHVEKAFQKLLKEVVKRDRKQQSANRQTSLNRESVQLGAEQSPIQEEESGGCC